MSRKAAQMLLAVRPELKVDRERPDVAGLSKRLAAMWLPDEVILYLGLAGTSLSGRVDAYYRTALGARGPHAGGWPLKMLTMLGNLSVHYAACDDVNTAERAMAEHFMSRVTPAVRQHLIDPALPLPFANLELPGGARKSHGITGARQPRAIKAVSASAVAKPRRATARIVPSSPGEARSQRVTANEINAAQVRMPAATKALLPDEPADVEAVIRGTRLPAKWDPRNGPDRARSGVLRIGRDRLHQLVSEDEVLQVEVDLAGRVILT